MKNLSVINLFSKSECNRIINSIEENSEKLRVSTDNGGRLLSTYEMNMLDLNSEIQELITNKTLEVINEPNIEISNCFIIKYGKDLIPMMGGHYDACLHTIVVNLNNDYIGGGTHFPILKYTHIPQEHLRGDGLFFKGSTLTSWHNSLPVIDGDRYVITIQLDLMGVNVISRIVMSLKLTLVTFIIKKFNLYNK
jgi:hypothetical protein